MGEPLGLAAGSYRLAHVSDVHVGSIPDGRIVDALIAAVNAASVDLVCVSGDLTVRALRHEFQGARAILGRLAAPLLVVPGNHDVFPLWRPVRRLRTPLARFAEYVPGGLAPVFERPGLAVLGLASAHGKTRKGGRIAPSALAAMEAAFGRQPAGTFKAVVVHHPLARFDGLGRHDVARGADAALALARRLGVDVVLSGHLHVSHVVPEAGDGRPVLVTAGTATSDRGKRHHRGANFFNVIHAGPGAFAVEEHRYDAAAGAFVATGRRTFAR